MPITPLAEIQPPDLIDFDRDSFVSEAIARIKQHPDWQRTWDGELYQNANQMIMHLFGYMFEKNAESFDRKFRENFLLSAKSDEGIAYNLQELQVDIRQNYAAQTTLECKTAINIIADFAIPQTSIAATDNNGDNITFEIIAKDANDKYDYLNSVSIAYDTSLVPGTFRTTAYTGTTQQYDVTMTGDLYENMTVTLPESPLIDDSIRVYYYDTNSGIYTELNEVQTFTGTETISTTFPNGKPTYQLNYDLNQQAVLQFGSSTAGGRFYDSHLGNTIVFFYRTGGGQATNIGIETIESTISVIIDPNVGYSSVAVTNITEGSGGRDYETIDEAKIYAPLRRGRDKSIVDKFDALNLLDGQVIKHKIKAPTYENEKDNIVPLLLNYHYFVPYRDNYATNTDLINVETANLETIALFKMEFLSLLNNYLNVQGIHEDVTEEIIRSGFKTSIEAGDNSYNVLGILDNLNALSGSLYINAYNSEGAKVDSITWTGNYFLNSTLNNIQVTSAAIVNTKELNVITITAEINDKIEVKFDEVSTIFTTSYVAGANLPVNMAKQLQDQITSDIITNSVVALYPYIYHTFVSWDVANQKMVFTSPTSGTTSKVIFVASTTAAAGLLGTLGLNAKTYKSSLSTGSVFDDVNSLFAYDTSELKIAIKSDNLEDQTEQFNTVAVQSDTIETGPITTVSLYDTELEQVTVLQTNQSINGIVVSFFNSSSTLIDECKFTLDGTDLIYGAATGNTNGTTDTTGILDVDLTLSTLIPSTSTFALKHLDGNQVTRYKQSFENITRIEFYQTDGTETLLNTFYPDSDWYQTITESDGPNIILHGINFADVVAYDYLIKIYGTSGTLLQTTLFDDSNLPSNGTGTTATGTSTPNPAIDSTRMVAAATGTISYDLSELEILIDCTDGEIDSSQLLFKSAFANYDYFTITYYKENYDMIKADYRPNPFHPEGEALTFINRLNAKNKRIIALENVVKSVVFTPVELSFELFVKDTSVATDARDYVFYTLHEYFNYSNINEYHNIGEKITISDIINIVMPNAGLYGITNITFSNATQTAQDAIVIAENEYHFILDLNMIDQLKSLETTYPALVGLSNVYAVSININVQET